MELAQLARGAEGEEGGLLIAVMDDLDGALALLAEAADLIQRQSRMAAVDMADDIGIGFQHHILVDEARAGDGGAAGVDRALDAVFAGPGHHALGFLARS